jgi:chitin synthase
MLQFAGQDLTNYFPPPMIAACPGLVTSDQLELRRANFTPILAYAVHQSGALQTSSSKELANGNWYYDKLQPNLKQYYKGSIVYNKNYVGSEAESSSR